jgi:hypothetical protein
VSAQSAQAVDAATRAVAEARAAAERLEVETLSAIADGLAAALDGLAKNTALAQPEVTKALGTDGIRELKVELQAQAETLAEDLRIARERIEWPTSETAVRGQDVHSALFKYLYGSRVNTLAAILKRHGYDVHDANAQHSQSLVLPQSLYDQNSFGLLAEALTGLGRAEAVLQRAQGEHDRDTVEDLWGNA